MPTRSGDLIGEGKGLAPAGEPEVRADRDVLAHGKTGEGLHDLEGSHEAECGDALRRHAGDVASLEEDAASIGHEEAGDEIEEGGLAGAVRADKGGDAALGEREAHLGHGGQAAEAARDPFERQHYAVLPTRRRELKRARPKRPFGMNMIMRTRIAP